MSTSRKKDYRQLAGAANMGTTEAPSQSATEAPSHRDGRFDGWAGEAGLTDRRTDARQTSLRDRGADSFPRVGASVGRATGARTSNRPPYGVPIVVQLCVSVALWSFLIATIRASFPAPQKYVSDNAEVISAPVRQAINRTLCAVRNRYHRGSRCRYRAVARRA